MRFSSRSWRTGYLLAILLVRTADLPAQISQGGVLGQVTDPAGAVITGAIVSIKSAAGQTSTSRASTTDRSGVYRLQGLPPGRYIITVTANGFAAFTQEVDIEPGRNKDLNISMSIQKVQEQLVVKNDADAVETDLARNSGAIVLSGKDLDRLSDDPDELEQQLRAMAVTAGGTSAQLYVDGFTTTRLPPKSAIREIRINQDPFSAEFESPGFGRIEVFTRPGTNQFHGNLSLRYNNASFNSRSPFLSQTPAYHSEEFDGYVAGPLSKNASFDVEFDRHSVNDNNVINALVLDRSLDQVTFSHALANPRLLTAASVRVDYQLNANNTFFVDYTYIGTKDRNDGAGQSSLASQAFDLRKLDQTLRFSDTMFLNNRIVNEARFQYQRDRIIQSPQDPSPQVTVLGAFIGGGSNLGYLQNNQDHYELQNYTSISAGRHLTRFGGRLRVATETDYSTPNFNGTFVFPSLTAFKITELELQQGLTPAQIRADGGGAEQFSINTGRPTISGTLIDAGVFAQDSWRLKANLTLGYGLRYEVQNDIGGRGDLAPRLGLAWGIHPTQKRPPRNVVRLGFGLFYTRFAQNLVLNAEQLNGTIQRQFIVQNPDFFPNPPPVQALASSLTTPTIYNIDPNLRAPVIVQTSASFEHQLPRGSKLSVTYLDSQGFRQLLSNNINAPLAGTFDISKPGSGVRPFPGEGNIYQYQSRGRFDQNQLIVNFTVNGLNKIQLNGGYTLGYAASNTGGAASFPSNPFDLNQDYGRASFDVRHRLNVGGRMELPLGFILNGLLIARSGQPFDITVGQDLNGDSIFNDRPSFATSLSSPNNVLKTRFGVFDTVPRPGQPTIPINFGTGPANFVLNLRLMKAIAIGSTEISSGTGSTSTSAAGKHDSFYRTAWHPLYTIRFEVFANNVLNHANLGIPVGNLSSPLFGSSIGLAGSPYSQSSATRQIVLRAVFSF